MAKSGPIQKDEIDFLNHYKRARKSYFSSPFKRTKAKKQAPFLVRPTYRTNIKDTPFSHHRDERQEPLFNPPRTDKHEKIKPTLPLLRGKYAPLFKPSQRDQKQKIVLVFQVFLSSNI
ncbi:MAG: hypothetical protein V6Z82_05640 [Flavobacteriales bacterium]